MKRPLLFAVCAAVTVVASTLVPLGATSAPAAKAPRRVFTTGFESVSDFKGMYISPNTASTQHGHEQHGFVEVFQSSKLVARAAVRGGHGTLEQAHFGMYAISSLTAGKVCNDDLKITSARA